MTGMEIVRHVRDERNDPATEQLREPLIQHRAESCRECFGCVRGWHAQDQYYSRVLPLRVERENTSRPRCRFCDNLVRVGQVKRERLGHVPVAVLPRCIKFFAVVLPGQRAGDKAVENTALAKRSVQRAPYLLFVAGTTFLGGGLRFHEPCKKLVQGACRIGSHSGDGVRVA